MPETCRWAPALPALYIAMESPGWWDDSSDSWLGSFVSSPSTFPPCSRP